MLVELQPVGLERGEFELVDADDAPKVLNRDRSRQMTAVDAVNLRYGREAIGVASA